MDIAHKQTDAIIAKIEKEIGKEYKQAHKEVSAKLDDYLQRFQLKDKKWQEWVQTGKKTQKEYNDWRTGQILVGKRWKEMKDTLAKDYANTAQIAHSIANGYIPDVYALNHNYSTFMIEKQSMLDTSYTLYSRESVERMYRDNPQLYSSKIGKKVQQQINEGKLMRWERRRIQSVLTQGVLQGESIPNLTKRLEKVTGGDHKAAIRNMRTMMTGVQNAGRVDAMERAKKMGIPVKKKWLATLDDRTRHWHRDLDGVAVELNESFENEYGEIEYPGDPNADGANVYNCRCTMISEIEGFEIDTSDTDLRHDKNLSHQSYDDWKKDRKSRSNPIDLPERKANAFKMSYIREYGGDGSGMRKNSRPDNEQTILQQFNRYTGTKTTQEILQQTNPNYLKDRAYRINCQRTVVAEELIYRGYDVEALPWAKDAIDTSGIKAWKFDNKAWYRDSQLKIIDKRSNFKNVVETAMDDWGDGSRAVVRLKWTQNRGGGGHFIFARKEKGGIIEYTDPQTGKVINISDYLKSTTTARNNMWIMRVDNRELSDDVVLAVRNVKR